MERPCHGTLLATASGLTSTTAEDCHLEVKDIEYDPGLIKNYCLTVSKQKSAEFIKFL